MIPVGKVSNGTVILPPDARLPEGTEVEVRPVAAGEAAKGADSFFDTIRDLIGSVEGPTDWAAEHDHYIHGTPKRSQK